MPVEVHKGQRSATLVCENCECRSRAYPCASPAALALSACEAAAKDHWSYTIGWQAMMMGHQTLCPACGITSAMSRMLHESGCPACRSTSTEEAAVSVGDVDDVRGALCTDCGHVEHSGGTYTL